MGIIIKQSFKGSIYSYIGLVLGYVNVGIIMPKIFGPEQIGLVQIFASLSLIFAQFSALGFTSVIFRLFPKFRNKDKGHKGFLFLVLATGAIGFLISSGAFLIFKPFTIDANIDKSPLLTEYLYLLIPLVFFRLLFNLLDAYNRVLFDAVTGILWQDFGHKAINLLLIIFFAFGWVDFQQFFFGYIISLSFPVIPIIFKLIKRGNFNLVPNFKFIDKSLGRGIIAVASFGFINSFSSVLVLNMDKILVIKYLSLEQVGIFSVCAL
ncbi:MAG: hypothetical protein CVU00_02290, partial [Bacteroidetes bacterium HGW-Bacteroidetes-17]